MGFRIIKRRDISDDTRAYLSYKSFTQYFVVNLIVNIIVWLIKIAFLVLFFPICLYLFVVTRIPTGKGKVIFSLVYFAICGILILIFSGQGK